MPSPKKMTLEEVKSQTPALLLPYAETIYKAMIIAEQSLSGMDLPESKGELMPPETGDGEQCVDPLNDDLGD
jgi:hypothetical protein